MDGEKRYTHRLDGETADMLKLLCKEHQRNGSQMVRWLIRVAHSVLDVGNRASDVRQAFAERSPGVIPVTHKKPEPESGTDLALQSLQKEEEKKEDPEKNKKAKPRLAPLDVSERIVGYINELAGTSMRYKAEGHRLHIQRRLNKGATEEEMREVIRKMAAMWKGTSYAKHLNPETLFGNKFDKYLDMPEDKPGTSNGSKTGKRKGMVARLADKQQGFRNGKW
jgi:uncharacterized phage protein (TIGR02220 family)